ncbi:MAG TPA: hypothetical protein VD738_09610 [Nitrospira sp.]|jgi:hypothetical protein|nr:hypothetical protein [Nitrospira sp.]
MRVACFVCLIGLFVLVVPASAGLEPSGSLKRSPTEIVKNYVRLDMKGARLDATSFDALRPYIDWTEEPAWNSVVVIQDVEVADDYRKWDIINNLEVIIPVTFHVRGFVQYDTAVFVPEEKTEEVRFHVKEVGNIWRIVAPMIPPHVGLKRMVNFVREAEFREQDVSQRAVLAALADSLRKSK